MREKQKQKIHTGFRNTLKSFPSRQVLQRGENSKLHVVFQIMVNSFKAGKILKVLQDVWIYYLFLPQIFFLS